MAELAEPVVSFIIERLSNLLIEEGKHLHGASDQAEQLQSELKLMQGLLRDADAKQRDDAVIREWISQSKDLAYEAEDLIETFAFKVGSRRGGGLVNVLKRYTCIFKECYMRHRVGVDIQGLNTRVSNLTSCFRDYGIRTIVEKEGPSSRQLRWIRRIYSHVEEEDFVGLERNVEVLVPKVVSEDGTSHYRVVSICGMGGLGKTTIARKVYNHPNVRRHFDRFAWFCISQQWQTKEILQGILVNLIPEKKDEIVKSWSADELVRQLYHIQQNKRCLIVLDDIWSFDAWECIKNAFPTREKGSKILVTTRNKDVVIRMDAFHHEPRLLSFDESWELFQKKALGERYNNHEGPIPGELAQISKKILDGCGGLPLAIILCARMLRTAKEDEWLKVLQSLPKTKSRWMYGGPQGLDYLWSAYCALPLRLKACFLYLGNFPNKSRIQVEKLCQLWIAEGLISAEDRASEETMMDVAAKYFSELVVRSLVTLEEDEVSDLRLMSGHVHDLIRDLCISVGAEVEFFEIMEREGTSYYQRQMRSEAQRCAIYFNRYYDVPDVFPSYNLRSLLCLNSEQSGQGSRWPRGLFNFKKLRLLRVLDFDRVSFQDGKLPEGVGELVHLRYLSFRGCYLEHLPSYIGNFLYLQTLDLRVQKDCIMTISNVIWKLKRLRHLYFPLAFQTSDHHGMLKLDSLKELEILEGLDTSVCKAEDLIKLTNLRILAATAEGNLKDLELIIRCIGINSSHLRRTSLDIKNFDCYSQEQLSFIRRLFSCHVLDTLQIEGHIGKMSDIGTISGRFTEIVLNGSELDQDPMPTLENLPNLRILVLEVEAYLGKKLHCSDTGFPELRSLKLSKLYNLEEWEVDEGALQKLSTLEVSMCRRIKKLPQGLQSIITLRRLKVSMMPQQFLGRLQMKNGTGGEDLHKINSKCSMEFGSDDPWLESTNPASQQNNSFDGRITESQASSSTHSPNITGSFACLPETERERDVYLQ
ncbi:putative disease resistance protein At1g50180 [Coffea arabica]|uniref:Disease resistance protein At1g50180 n=1 Tax=Coffea arabica TaxID=13443 RepID=A0A6P6WZI1_COFAR|nr:probable disease resistance protein At1g58602 [Coffea arabica]